MIRNIIKLDNSAVRYYHINEDNKPSADTPYMQVHEINLEAEKKDVSFETISNNNDAEDIPTAVNSPLLFDGPQDFEEILGVNSCYDPIEY
jgi:hypothetical protein